MEFSATDDGFIKLQDLNLMYFWRALWVVYSTV